MAQTTINDDTSMGDIRAMLADPTPAAEPAAVAQPVTAEPPAQAEEKAAEAGTETAIPETKDEPLPPGVEKRIAKEFAKRDDIQRKIDEAVSERKAKEAELAALNGKSGSEPATTTAPVKDGKPIKPTFGKEGQTWQQFQEDLAKYETDNEAWLKEDTKRTVKAELEAERQQVAAKARWDKAIETHGKDFPALMEQAQAIAPEGLQQAISALDDWSGVAVHLAKNPAQLKELAAKFEANPYAAIATLGRIEASLKSPKSAADPLPKPPATVGGSATASAGAFDWENAPMSAFKAQVAKARKG